MDKTTKKAIMSLVQDATTKAKADEREGMQILLRDEHGTLHVLASNLEDWSVNMVNAATNQNVRVTPQRNGEELEQEIQINLFRGMTMN